MYSQTKPGSDCSGIFHRVLDGLSVRCGCFSPPSYRDYRSTRQLAQWYHEQGDLLRVTDPLKDSELIGIGAVMFSGATDGNMEMSTSASAPVRPYTCRRPRAIRCWSRFGGRWHSLRRCVSWFANGGGALIERYLAPETPKGLLGIRTDLCVIRLAIRRTAWIRYGDVRQV